MFKVFRSQPVNYGLRAAIGFGAAFPTSVVGFMLIELLHARTSIISRSEVFYYDLFHTLPLYEIISWIPSALGFLLAGLLIGGLLAVLFADRSTYPRYILAGTLGWFLHRAMFDLVWHPYQWAFFLGTRHNNYFNMATLTLSGAFLGLIFIAARSERRETLRFLTAGTIAFPIIAYLYIKLLFNFSVIATPWLFIALMILIAVCMSGVAAFAIKSDGGRKNLWLVAVSAIGYPLLARTGFFLASLVYAPTLPMTIYPGGVGYWPMVSMIVLTQVVYGVLFGLLVGAAWGVQRKNRWPQSVVSA